ncbi:MAG: Coenzyme F420 hydrogenase/dehydrogenase, beta subunit C-terminal domain [Hyphomicrobiales bacterium]
MQARITSTDDIVQDGLFISCGLCAAIAGPAQLEMGWTQEGRLRPIVQAPLDSKALSTIEAVCPGLSNAGVTQNEAAEEAECDSVWGWVSDGFITWAGDDEVRFKSSAGGALNALSIHLLDSGEVNFVLHTGPDPERPARSKWRISRTREDVLGAKGSRYGPSAPLEGLEEVLTLDEPFAFVGKPCDVGALRLYAKRNERLAKLCKYRLALVCGGASEFGKTKAVLDIWNVDEDDISMLRYRGRGNPGPMRMETSDGRSFEISYGELWEDEATWQLQHRCKICPDAIGEAADVIAMDCWPGGSPSGEDDGFNALVTRTDKGNALAASAIKAGALVLGEKVGVEEMSLYQPHQVRKKNALWARLAGQRAAGLRTMDTGNLRIADLPRRQAYAQLIAQARGTKLRAKQGRISEPAPKPKME